MRALWKGSITFGLVNIPVKLYNALESHHLDLNLLRRDDLCPIRYARVCRADGQEVPWKDIVKGYQYRSGDYVILEREDFESAYIEKADVIQIKSFVYEDEIETIFYDKVYYLEPQEGNHKAYALLREALAHSGMLGLVTFVLRNREHIGVLRSSGALILLNQLRYHDDLRDQTALDLPPNNLVKDEEVQMAQRLIQHLTMPFNPKTFKDTYLADLKNIIEEKVKGKEVKKLKKAAPSGQPDEELLDLLKASLEDKKEPA